MAAEVRRCALTPVPTSQRLDSGVITRLVEAATLAPSGGNSQPWQWLYDSGRLFLFRDPSRSSFLDIASTGSYVALGAAAENLVLKAHAVGLAVELHPLLATDHRLVAAFTFAADTTELPAAEEHLCDHLVDAIDVRMTNRTLGPRRPIAQDQVCRLERMTRSLPGAQLSMVTSAGQLDELSSILGAVERLRLCNSSGHHDFVNEIRWTEQEARATNDGIDLATIDLTATERAGLSVARDWPVVAAMKKWGGGGAFEQLTRKSIDAASCVGLLTMPTWSGRAFFDGGRALQRVWLSATLQGISMQPVASATFMFARLLHAEGAGLDDDAAAELQSLRERFVALFPTVSDQRGEILLMRMSLAAEAQTRALRRPVTDVLTFQDRDNERGADNDR